jgi:hypothetical protein
VILRIEDAAYIEMELLEEQLSDGTISHTEYNKGLNEIDEEMREHYRH